METRAITEGAMICALSVILSLLSYYVPFMILFYIFIPVPIIIISQRRGFLTALIASIAATIILFFFIDMMTAIAYGFYLILVGCGLGYMYYTRKSGLIKMLVGYSCVFITIFAMLGISQLIMGQNVIEEIVAMFSQSMDLAMNIYKDSGAFSTDQLSQLQTIFSSMMDTMKMTLPLSFLLAPFFVAWPNILISDAILKKMRTPVNALKPVSQWVLPQSFKWFLMLVMMVLFILDITGYTGIPEIYTFTIMQIINMIFVLMGMAFLFWFFNRKRQKESMVIKVGIVLITLFVPFVANIVSFIGIGDIYLNLKQVVNLKDGMKK